MLNINDTIQCINLALMNPANVGEFRFSTNSQNHLVY